MEDLHLEPRSHESKRRVQWDDTPTPAEEKSQRRKQIRFDVDEDLGNDPTLPMGLTLLLAEDMAEKWNDTPCSSTPVPIEAHSWPLLKSPSAIAPTWEGASLKYQPNHPLVDPNQGLKKVLTQ